MRAIILSILFIISLLFWVTCFPGDKEKRYLIGVSQCSLSDEWRQAMVSDMEVEALDHPELRLEIADAYYDNNTQIRQIRDFIKRKVDLLIISSNEMKPVTEVAVEAFRAGIPTIILDRKIDSDEYTTFIGADNYEIGRSIGMLISSMSNGRPITVLEVWGVRGSSSAMERHEGFSDAIAIDPNITLKEVDGYWVEERAYESVRNMGSLDDIDVVFAHNDLMALGARLAIEERSPSLLDRIKFIGVDALPGAGLGVEAVAQGKLDASFYYPTGGGTAIEVASQILNGRPYSRKYTLSTAIVDKPNAGTLYLQSERLVDYQRQIENQRESLAQLDSRYYSLYTSLIVTFVLILLLVGSVVYMVYINLKIRQKHAMLKERNREVQLQKEELAIANKRIEQVTAQKLQLFTNVSHEVRTPLTLILASSSRMSNEQVTDELVEDINVLRKNAKRLKHVIDQLLDLRSMENNKMPMRVSETDIIPFINEVASCFDGLARCKHIEFSFRHGMEHLNLWVDRDKMDKILTNLLSNSFKFTPDGGHIAINIEDAGSDVIITVEDDGSGISKEHIGSVFDQFFTAGNDYVPGTGIGLHLTREFVNMHGGTITAESEPGVRTLLTVRLPKGNSHLPPESIVMSNSMELVESTISEVDTTLVNEALEKHYDYSVLVVEDDSDISEFICNELSRNFNVFSAEDGVKALEKLSEENISLVISDVMMPNMNGFELCHRIKGDVAFSHIPVILLTALSEDSQRMYGIERGADEYIQKPFNIDVVRLRVIKLLEAREQLRERFKSLHISSDDQAQPLRVDGTMDDIFMRKFMEIIEENYADPEFNIERASERLALSRVHLYRKIKDLSGMTPTELLRDYRLKRASVLLRERRATISEIAYAVGFGSQAYFSKCFKDLYGVKPSDLMEPEGER